MCFDQCFFQWNVSWTKLSVRWSSKASNYDVKLKSEERVRENKELNIISTLSLVRNNTTQPKIIQHFNLVMSQSLIHYAHSIVKLFELNFHQKQFQMLSM